MSKQTDELSSALKLGKLTLPNSDESLVSLVSLVSLGLVPLLCEDPIRSSSSSSHLFFQLSPADC